MLHTQIARALETRRTFLAACVVFVAIAAPARAQEPPPKIGLYVIDLHGSISMFPSDANLAASRGMAIAELPGPGLGLHLAAHVYPLRWRAVTFGLGGEMARSRSRQQTPAAQAADTQLRGSTERFKSEGFQLSFNFGTGKGWSYISGGLSRSRWSLVPEGRDPFPTDSEPLKTINYGGGARWFAKNHVAFSFDVRFYAINPGSAYLDFPHPPRTTLMVIGAGISVK